MIGIVGAGIGGLALSRYLDEAGVDHIVLEAGERAGGVIRSTRVGGRVLDHGPQRTRVSPPVEALIRAAGLEKAVVPLAPKLPLFVYREGRLRRVPFSFSELAHTDLLTPLEKMRALLEPMTAPPRPEEANETVGELFIRKFGEGAYLNLLGPLFGGLFGSDPREMYARHALAPILRGLGVSRSILWRFARGALHPKEAAPVVSFREGMAQLPEGLLRLQQKHVRLGTRVEGLRKQEDGWILDTRSESIEVDQVVLTGSAEETSRLLRNASPDAGARLATLNSNALALVHLQAYTPLHGLGYQVAFGESLRTRGVTWNAPALGRDGIYTAFLGGAKDPGLVALSDGEIGTIARSEFEEVTGHRSEWIGVSRTWMPAWDRSWVALDGLELPRGLHLCANFESRVGVPSRVERARRLAESLAGTRQTS